MMRKLSTTANVLRTFGRCKRLNCQAIRAISQSSSNTEQKSNDFQNQETHFGFQKVKESEKVGKGMFYLFILFTYGQNLFVLQCTKCLKTLHHPMTK